MIQMKQVAERPCSAACFFDYAVIKWQFGYARFRLLKSLKKNGYLLAWHPAIFKCYQLQHFLVYFSFYR